ncbi:helix-turn-helix transcriptional regulator [Actinacidiphila sp. DG2A-62]|uniref:helix-turn-helix transcriptional regulator n=1 Tax=Actinacidiphila sp. DG2A-62 TaxID=3108821 RepID=UPI002DB5747F|nr:helix-turn-helix transcriptional regulator [Actinacidiphila sp. DG2A-62]MEC3996099.1 helix-turn-helix transcriptional regulator [Actinacidiphila sp. DG2A-62]
MEETLGAGGLLRAWRAAAGARSGRPMLQRDVARALDRSERWYRDLESGTFPRPLTREERAALGKVFGLDMAQRHALLLATVGELACQVAPKERPQLSDELRLLLDRQPFPAYVVDPAWNVLAVNEVMAKLFPWSAEPEANLMRWLLLNPEAREQHLDWQADAVVCVRMLRAAAVARPKDCDLQQLIHDTTQDPIVRGLWTRSAGDITEHHDGHVLRIALPTFDGRPAELVTHVMEPAGLPGCRMTILAPRTPKEPPTSSAAAA